MYKRQTDNSGKKITSKKDGITYEIYDEKISYTPNVDYYFILGNIQGRNYAFNLELKRKSKSKRCGTPHGGTQTDDKPSHQIINKIINDIKQNLGIVIEKDKLDIISIFTDHSPVINCSTSDTAEEVFFISDNDAAQHNLMKWDTYGFYTINGTSPKIIDNNSITTIDKQNWK